MSLSGGTITFVVAFTIASFPPPDNWLYNKLLLGGLCPFTFLRFILLMVTVIGCSSPTGPCCCTSPTKLMSSFGSERLDFSIGVRDSSDVFSLFFSFYDTSWFIRFFHWWFNILA